MNTEITLPTTHLFSRSRSCGAEILLALTGALRPFGSVPDAARTAALMLRLLDARPPAEKAADLGELWCMLAAHGAAGPNDVTAKLVMGDWSVAIWTPGDVLVKLSLTGAQCSTRRWGGYYRVEVDFGRESTNCARDVIRLTESGEWAMTA